VSLLLVSGVACAYATAVVGTHRLGVARRRRAAHGYPTLAWFDWGALLGGFLGGEGPESLAVRPADGGPALTIPDDPSKPGRRELLAALVQGQGVGDDRWSTVGFSESEARWLATLALAQRDPAGALSRLERAGADTAPAVYLREHLAVLLEPGPFSLELAVFRVKRRLAAALHRFDTAPELYFARARASACLGLTEAVIDDLARAVYFSRERPFFLRAVVGLQVVSDLRPALWQQCAQSLSRREVFQVNMGPGHA